MKKIFSWIVAALFILSTFTAALAENETTDVNDTVEVDENVSEEVVITTEDTNETEETEVEEIEIEINDEEEPSVTPDEPIRWGLKRAIERIDLALTFNKASKAKKGLRHAKERLLEVEAMIAAKKLDAAEKAQKVREKIMERVQENVEEMGDGAEEDVEDVLEIENEVEEQENRMQMLKVKFQFKGNLTEEQRAKIDSLMESFQNKSQTFKLKLQEKKTQIKLKIKAMTEKTDEEIEELMQAKEEKLGIGDERVNRVQALTKVIEKLEEKKETVKGINVSGVIGKLTQVRGRLQNKTEEHQRISERIKEKIKEVKNETQIEGDEGEEEIEIEAEEEYEAEDEDETKSGQGSQSKSGNSE